MPPRLQSTFAKLSASLQRHFGGDSFIWYPAAAGGTAYTVAVACRQAADRGATADLAGFLSKDAATITLQAEKTAFPFPPDEDHCFLFGPAVSGSPAASCLLYQITSVEAPEMFTHVTITARRH